VTSTVSSASADGRNETRAEQLDRNTMELLNELRVAGTGIQVMFAFLLVVPFQTGWKHVSSFGQTTYIVTLLCVAIAAVLLMAPSIHHRILFRHREKRYLVETANRVAIAAMAFLAAGFAGILVLISDVVVGAAAPWIFGIAAAIGIAALWFVWPLSRIEHETQSARGSGVDSVTGRR
jgi:ABC-type Fe3+-siderophore transport system permease subunit